jgi:hypothetical protein
LLKFESGGSSLVVLSRNTAIVNDHLKVVFEEMLPALHYAGLKYWVYGGVAVAGVKGQFLRENRDVDIYVRNSLDFDKARTVLRQQCHAHPSWKPFDPPPLSNGRPKFEVKVDGKERLSIVPVYVTERGVEFRAKKTILLPPEALVQESKTIAGYRFPSPSLKVIKILLGSFVTVSGKRLMESRRKLDIDYLFSEDEIAQLLKRPNVN